ncbi:MAG: GTPase Era [Bacillota bacterium]
MSGPRRDGSFRSGMVTIVGRPNVGKSTLLNRLVGRKVAIMSDKPQTTRNRITGVLTRESSQIVFIDTPGLHRPKHQLGEYMVRVALAALREVEGVLFVVEAHEPPGPGDRFVAERLAGIGPPVVLVANKADLCRGDTLRQHLEAYAALGEFAGLQPVSALRDPSFELLIRTIEDLLPEGPRYYPEDMVTDQPEAFVIAELVREKVLELTRDEVPHSVAVAVEELRPAAGRSKDARPERAGETGPAREDMLYVRAVIYVERDSQKGIIVGAKGSRLGEIGRLARREMEALFGNRIYLDLWVKVEKNWRDRAGVLRALGYTLPRD